MYLSYALKKPLAQKTSSSTKTYGAKVEYEDCVNKVAVSNSDVFNALDNVNGRLGVFWEIFAGQ